LPLSPTKAYIGNVIESVLDNVLDDAGGRPPARSTKVTIEDVAALARVSISTVSRVVNGRYGVARATEARVKGVIADLGYESSLVARSLRSHRTNVLGVVVTDFEPFSAELLKGAARFIRDTHYELIVYSGAGHAGDEPGWEARYLARLSGTLADGIVIVTPTVVDVPTTSPVVAVDPHLGPSNMPTVDSQNFEGAMTATRHLLQLGHRRIGFITGRPDLVSARLREQGYRSALEQAGIAFDPDLLKVGKYTAESAEGPATELLTLDDPPTAIFAANDVMAIRTMEVARDLGLRVPDDVSIVGFDNIPESALAEPPLTTIDQSIAQMGYEAARLLVDLIANPDQEPQHVSLPTRLVERHTCRAIGPLSADMEQGQRQPAPPTAGPAGPTGINEGGGGK
jgi:LacI family transcriptional regulator